MAQHTDPTDPTPSTGSTNEPHNANPHNGGPELNGNSGPPHQSQAPWSNVPPAPEFEDPAFLRQGHANPHVDPWERTEINMPVARNNRGAPVPPPPPAEQVRAPFPPPMQIDADPGRWDSAEFRRPGPADGRHRITAPSSPAVPSGYPNNPNQFYPPIPAPTQGDEAAWPPAVAESAPQGPDETAWSTAAAERTGPKQGWRGGLAKIGIKLSKSARELDYDRDVLRMKRKLAYPQNVVFVSLKGGVGKSTSTIAMGSTLAHHRDVSDVVAFDSATDGSLRRRMPVEQNRAVTSDTRLFLRSVSTRKLSGSEIQVQLYSNPAGLQALVAAQHYQDYELAADEFDTILGALHREYMVNLIDMSPDRRVPTFWPAIRSAHAVVLVTTPNSVSIDNVKRFIDLLRDSDYKYLLTRTVLLWNDAAPGNEVVINVDATKNVLVRELSPQNDPSTCLVDIPLDPHLATGGEINLSLLRKDTRRQFERAAALLMDKLPDRTAQH